MKNLKQIVICVFLVVASALQAQEVQHQSEIIKANVSKGDYKIIADQYKSHSGRMEITDINKDRAQPNGHFEIILKEYPDHATESTRNETAEFFADNIAFPVTYLGSTYEGNKKLQDKVGYVVREGRGVGSDRIVFINNYLFVLHQWQNKDDYQVRYVLKSKNSTSEDKTEKKKKKKKKKGFFKSLKDGMKNASSGGVSIEKLKADILQPYLDNATKKQETFYAQWIKKPQNASTVKYMEDKRVLMEKAMNKYNDDIFNSPEYQRMLAHQKLMRQLDAEASANEVTILNNTGKRINIRVDGNGGNSTIEVGSSDTFDCTKDIFYNYKTGNHTNHSDINNKVYSSNSKCGGTVTIN